ncbi:MAG: type IV pilus assembly protein PilM [Solirubrobacterales bacterium]
MNPKLEIRKKKTEPSLVGVEIEAGSVAATEVLQGGGIAATAIAPLPAGAFRDGEVIESELVTETLRSLFSANRLSSRVRLGIANHRVVVRTMRLPAIADPEELDAAVRFQAQEAIPMPIEQAVLDHRVVGGVPAAEGAPAQIDVIVIAARRDMIEATLKPLRDAGLDPVGIDLSAFGLIRALGDRPNPGAHPGAEPSPVAATLYCNVGDVTNLAIARGRSCLFTRVSPVGLDDVVSGLCGETGLSPEHGRMWLSHVGLAEPIEAIEGDPLVVAKTRSALERGAASVIDEVRLSLDFYGTQEAAVPAGRVVLSGSGSTIPGLASRMETILGLPVAVGRAEALDGLDFDSAARLTTAYGLALDS